MAHLLENHSHPQLSCCMVDYTRDALPCSAMSGRLHEKHPCCQNRLLPRKTRQPVPRWRRKSATKSCMEQDLHMSSLALHSVSKRVVTILTLTWGGKAPQPGVPPRCDSHPALHKAAGSWHLHLNSWSSCCFLYQRAPLVPARCNACHR